MRFYMQIEWKERKGVKNRVRNLVRVGQQNKGCKSGIVDWYGRIKNQTRFDGKCIVLSIYLYSINDLLLQFLLL